jgi:hypothetical protein
MKRIFVTVLFVALVAGWAYFSRKGPKTKYMTTTAVCFFTSICLLLIVALLKR